MAKFIIEKGSREGGRRSRYEKKGFYIDHVRASSSKEGFEHNTHFSINALWEEASIAQIVSPAVISQPEKCSRGRMGGTRLATQLTHVSG